MKKIVSLLLCLMLLAVFASCVDPKEEDITKETTTGESTTATTEQNSQESTAETDENDGWTNIY